VFLTGAASRPSDARTATSVRELTALVAEGIRLEDSGRILRWGTH
jgi:hypothetical protein